MKLHFFQKFFDINKSAGEPNSKNDWQMGLSIEKAI